MKNRKNKNSREVRKAQVDIPDESAHIEEAEEGVIEEAEHEEPSEVIAEGPVATLDELTEVDPDLLTGGQSDDTSSKLASVQIAEQKKSEKNDVAEVTIDLDATETPDKSNLKKNAGLAFVVLAVLAVLATVAFTIFYNTGMEESMISPLTINGRSISSDEFSFMYHYELLSNGVDLFASGTEAMLDGPCDEDPSYATYRDYFRDLAAKDLQLMEILYDDATEKGYGIEQEHYDRAQAYIDWLTNNADTLGVSFDTYVHGVFGSQVDKDCIVETLAKKYFTDDYAEDEKLVELSATDEQAEEAYEADRNTYDLVSYKLLRITYEQRDQAFIDTANKHAQEIIDKMAGDSDTFETVAAEYFSGTAAETLAEEDSTLVPDCRYEDITHTDFRDWLFDAARADGDATIFEDEDGFPIILVFVTRERMMTPVRDIYTLTVYPEYNDDGTVNVSIAQSLAQELYDYVTNEASISAAENIYNDYVLSGTLSVMHEQYAYLYEFDDDINDWVFDDSRTQGDKTIIDDGMGTFKVLFFEAESENPEWYDRVNSFIRMNNYQAFLDEQKAIYTYEFNNDGLSQIQDVP